MRLYSLVFTIILAGCVLGCRPLVCGAGTVERDGACVVQTVDGGVATDAGVSADSGQAVDSGVSVPFGYHSVRIAVSGAQTPDGELLIPVGLPVTLTPYGAYSDGTSQIPPLEIAMALRWHVTPDDGSVTLRAHGGVAELTATREGAAQVTVEGRSADGFMLQESIRVRAVTGGAVTLRSISVQDGPWFRSHELYQSSGIINLFNSFEGSAGPPLPANAPTGGVARVLTQYLVSVPVPTVAGGTVAERVRYVVDPSQLTYDLAPGAAATVDADGVVRSTGPGDAVVTVSLGSATPATATVHFVSPAPTLALRLVGEGPVARVNGERPLEWSAPAGTLTLAGVSALDPATLPTLSWVGTKAGTVLTAWVIARHGDTSPYFEWLPWSTASRTVLALPTGYTVDDSGVLTMKDPGIGLSIVTSGGMSMPLLARVPAPYGTMFGLRATPAAVSLVHPPTSASPDACADLSLFVTMPGAAERPLSELEKLGVLTNPPVQTNNLLKAGASTALHWCAARNVGSVRTGQIDVSFLNGRTSVPLEITGP